MPDTDGLHLDTLDHRAALLERWADARQLEHAAIIAGTTDERYAASWAVTDAAGAVDDLDERLATVVLLGLKLAARHYPEVLRDTLVNFAGQSPLESRIDQLEAAMREVAGVLA